MGMLTEFKTFASKGNVIDLAVGVIIGGAFGKIVGSLVNDIIMPPVGLLLAGVDFKEAGWTLKEKIGDAPAVILKYGAFIQSAIDFLIIAFVIFLFVKGINNLQRKKTAEPEAIAAPPEPSSEEKLLTEIRDLLKKA